MNSIKIIYQFALAFVFLFVCNIQINGTHLVGGEIYYEQTGTNNYLITLKVYRDCGPDNINDTQFDTEAYIGIYSGNSLIQVIDIDFNDAIVSEVPITSDNPCFILPPDLCIEEAIYQATTTLQPNGLGYDLVYQRCCRNNSIVNIINADNSGMSIFSHIPGQALTESDNTSPIFDNFPPVALCLGAEFDFDHSATDEDGDDLVYEFYTPFLGGGPDGNAPDNSPDNPQPNPPQPPDFDEIVWAFGYDVNYQIAASTDFEIDPETGQITGTPNQIGRYAIGVAVHEFRNGFYLNTTYRDFQYNVTLCDPNIIAAVPDQEQFCDGLTFNFSSESENATSYFWDFGDPNVSTDTSSVQNPSYTYDELGTYEVTLIANPSWPCADTSYAVYEAYPLLSPSTNNSNYECLNDESFFDFESTGNFETTVQFSWDFGPNANPQFSDVQNPQNVQFSVPGTQEITLVVSDFGCEENALLNFEVPEDPIANLEPQDIFCNGFTFEFDNNSENADSYYWDFGDPQNVASWSTQFEPEYTYLDSGTYVVSLTAMAPMTCEDVTTGVFTIHTLLNPGFEETAPQCFEGNSFDFEAMGTVDTEAVYDWQFGSLANPISSSLESPQNVSFSETGTYEVTLTISENGCVKDFTGEVQVVANPEIGFIDPDAEGCPILAVQFEDTSFSETPIYYLWEFGDGNTSTFANPVHFYENTGSYDIKLTINTLFGCIDEQVLVVEDAVRVYEEPKADFQVEPTVVNILDPTVSINDFSVDAVECEFYVEDHGTQEECNFDFTFDQAGWFDVTQVVINQYGCVDSLTREVTVEGFLFYVPNSFSPNGDGHNDYFLTEGTGIKDFHIDIFDRWGTLIHSGNEMETPWMGEVRGGEHFAQNGTYIYHILIHDLLGMAHEYVGNITLFR